MVLPQHDHRVDGGLAGPSGGEHAGEHRGGTGLGELVDQNGRAVIEEMRVVDEDEEGLAAGVLREFAGVMAEQLGMRLGPPARGTRSTGRSEANAPNG